MKLTITNFRGITKASIELGTITLIAGKNFAGKSSIVSALAALLAGVQLPSWCKKKDAGQLVNGDGKALIAFESESYTCSIGYPAVDMKAQGIAPRMSLIASGTKSPIDFDAREKAKYYSELLKTEPTEEEFKNAMYPIFSDKPIPDTSSEAMPIKSVWNSICQQGWDGAYERAKSKGAEFKGAWLHVTGEQYGETKAANWTPEGFAGKPDEEAQDALNILREHRDEMLKATAAKTAVRAAKTESDKLEIEKLRAIIAERPKLVQNLKTFRDILHDTEKDIKAFNLKTVKPVSAESQPCPACKAPLSVIDGKIVKAAAPNKAEQDATQRAYDKIMSQVADLETVRKTKERSIMETEQAIKVCDIRQSELNALLTKPDVSEPEPKAVDTSHIDEQITTLQAQLDIHRMYEDAQKYHNMVLKNKAIQEVLSPAGLRYTVLKRGLEPFNTLLETLSKKSGFGIIKLEDNLEITLKGRNYHLISKSEKYRVMVILQIAIAMTENSEFIIIDDTETIVGKKDRNGLLRVVGHSKIPTLVCMAMPAVELEDGSEQPPALPNLSKIGGVSYWIENGLIGCQGEKIID